MGDGKQRERSVVDAGPCIAFCAVDQQSLLYNALDFRYDIYAPDVVDDEIRRMHGRGFERTDANWGKLADNGRVTILPSEIGDKELEAEVARISGMPLAQQLTMSKDLGEIIAIAHAKVMVAQGHSVVLLIDDQAGTDLAHVNGITTISSIHVVRFGIMLGLIRDRQALGKLYTRLRQVNDSLVPIKDTNLLDKKPWEIAAARAAKQAEAEAEAEAERAAESREL